MDDKKLLKNKPLVEAIFELHWSLQDSPGAASIDPHFEVFFGRFYDRVLKDYPIHVRLPTASMPAEIAQFVPRHQFRRVANGWPLIQIGHGVATLNDTDAYDWDDFRIRVESLLSTLYDTYPSGSLRPEWAQLRYIDAIAFDYGKENAFDFLKNHMKTRIELNEGLFKDTGVTHSPLGFDLRFGFASEQPKGTMTQRLVTGESKGKKSLIWETIVQSSSVEEV